MTEHTETMELLRKHIEAMDDWIKEFHSRLNAIEEKSAYLDELSDNLQHNYELIQEVHRQLDYINQMQAFVVRRQNELECRQLFLNNPERKE